MMWIVNHEEARQHIPELLCQKKICSSHKQARKLIDQGSVSVNGCTIRVASHKLQPQDQLSVREVCLECPAILYEDEFFFAISKPAGLSSHEMDVCRALRREKLFLVHRLDKYTSGVLLIAKNPWVETALVKMFCERSIEKEYVAFVHGICAQPKIITLPLEEKKRSLHNVIWGVAQKGRGREAVTKMEPVISSSNGSYVKLFPLTGRTHQLRIHMAAIGHPILGDFVYGYPSSLPYYALHCERLSFDHPYTHKRCSLHAKIPLFIQELGSSLFKNKHWLL